MRNRYLDLLRAVATVRVVVYHSTGWAALTVVFPAMSVMFALAGSMMAASLDRHGPWAVERRLQRLLPALWVLVAVAVPSMLAIGLVWDWQVLLWAFPLQDPPATGYWLEALAAMWYLRDFLWFVLLSPLVLPIFRRFPLPTILTPYVGLAVITFAGLHPPLVVRDMALYGGAWLLGFAHHDGLLAKRRWWLIGALAVSGAAWALTHPGPRGLDLNDIPLANALWSAAFVLVLLGCSPQVRSSRLLTVLNARALTIYLWHVPFIVALSRLATWTGLPIYGWVGITWRLAAVTLLLGLVVLAVGWVEDVSAGRRPRLIPGVARSRVPVSPAPVLVIPQPSALPDDQRLRHQPDLSR
ncbi:acyltransferase family protein [Paractinoplanes rishiriensis]|uniref:Integral membrane transferase n=1 Tax=Paractinoplanes rishiriensis TaxID=1050105 RepID=A0A919MYP3_9ACTN|nr:acyltransferase [Actinoplanes rishiriensis]GIF00180.1 integral membrane transferase [Actinoplanes rishiriensis]